MDKQGKICNDDVINSDKKGKSWWRRVLSSMTEKKSSNESAANISQVSWRFYFLIDDPMPTVKNCLTLGRQVSRQLYIFFRLIGVSSILRQQFK